MGVFVVQSSNPTCFSVCFQGHAERALRERLPGCLKTYQRQASTVMAGKSAGSIRVGTSAFAAMFSWGGQTQGRAQRAPVETAPSDWNVERKDVASCCYVSSRKRLSGLPGNVLLDQIEHQIVLIRVILRVYIAPVVREPADSSSRPRPEVSRLSLSAVGRSSSRSSLVSNRRISRNVRHAVL